MATFKAEVYAHQKRADGTWNIKIRVTHQKRKKYLATPYYVYKEDLTRTFKLKNQHYIDECDKMIRKYRSVCERLGERINTMDVEQVCNYILNAQEDYFDLDIVKYGRDIAKSMHESGHDGNAQTYEIAINNLVKFVGREKISIREITVSFIKNWIKWIQEQPAPSKKEKGTRAQSLYPSNLRTIHNKAKKEFNDEEAGIIRIPLSPFSKIKLPKVPVSRKRALDPKQIIELAALPYAKVIQPGNNRFNLAKDLFLLSFALIGINAVDLYYCTDYKNGRLTYNRTKTKNRREDEAEISIKIQPEIKPIFDKYRDPKGERVFNFYHHYSSVDAFTAALNGFDRIDKKGKRHIVGLKKIGYLLGINDLEFYSARHSWATIAINFVGVDKFAVHTALNHVDEKMRVTDLYVKKSWDPIDQANRKVLDYIKLDIGSVEEPMSDKMRNIILPKQKEQQTESKS